MGKWALGFVALMAALPSRSMAQTERERSAVVDSLVRAATAPSQLLALLREEQRRLGRIARERQQYDSISKVLRELTARMAARFAPEQVSPGERIALARLYELNDQRERAVALAKATEKEPLSVADRSELLLIFFRAATGDHREREAITDRIDSLGDSARAGQLVAHGELYHSLWYPDIKEHVRRQRHHVEKAVAAAIAIGPDSSRAFPWVGLGSMVANLVDRLRSVGDSAAADSVREWGLVALDPFGRRATYELRAMKVVGTTITDLPATHWLNAPPGFTSYDPRGKVTLVMMTAHW